MSTKVFSNREDIVSYCNEKRIPVDVLSSEESVFLKVNGLYAFVRDGGMWQIVENVDELKNSLNLE